MARINPFQSRETPPAECAVGKAARNAAGFLALATENLKAARTALAVIKPGDAYFSHEYFLENAATTLRHHHALIVEMRATLLSVALDRNDARLKAFAKRTTP